MDDIMSSPSNMDSLIDPALPSLESTHMSVLEGSSASFYSPAQRSAKAPMPQVTDSGVREVSSMQDLRTHSSPLPDDLSQAEHQTLGKRKRLSEPFIGPRKKRGRPAKPPGTKKKRGPKQPKGRTILRGHVKHTPPLDVWSKVWEVSSPATLLTMQQVCRSFKDELARHPAIWKSARLYTFDEGLPDPPEGVSEAQYAWLLSGFGCQACDNKAARRVYWCWASRWCEACLKRLTVLENCLTDGLPDPRILDSIPHAVYDGFERYLRVGPSDTMLHWRRSENRVYLRADLKKVIEEYETFTKTKPTLDQATAWFTEHEHKALDVMQHLNAIESILIEHDQIEIMKKRNTRDGRRQEIVEKCKQMCPPITLPTLKKMRCFKLANRIDRPMNNRCWNALEPKILDEYQAIVKTEREMANQAALAARRQVVEAKLGSGGTKEGDSPARDVLKSLFREALRDEVGDSTKWRLDRGRDVNDVEDFGLRMLREIRRRYYELSDEARPKGEDGKAYVLSMEDAIILMSHDLQISTNPWNTRQKTKGFRSFKCPKCKEADYGRKSFSSKLLHVVQSHAFDDSQFASLKCMYEPGKNRRYEETLNGTFVAWPKNMPILSALQPLIDEPWDPDNELQYHHAAPAQGEGDTATTTFDGLYKGREPSKEGPAPDKLVANIIHAALKLKDIGLSAKTQTVIALDYGAKKLPKSPEVTEGQSNVVHDNIRLPLTQPISGGAINTNHSPLQINTNLYPVLQSPPQALSPQAGATAEFDFGTDSDADSEVNGMPADDTPIDPALQFDLDAPTENMDLAPHQIPHAFSAQIGSHQLSTLPTELVRHGLFDILNRSKCGICSSREWGALGGRRRDQWHTVGPLLQHYYQSHGREHKNEWAEKLWLRPGAEEVSRELAAHPVGRRLFEELFPCVEGVGEGDVEEEREGLDATGEVNGGIEV